MLVFTDGLDTQSWLRAAAVLDTARQSMVVPYAVVAGEGVKPFTVPSASLLSGGGPSDPSARFLWDLVQAGGGLFMNAEATDQLERRFTEALDSFRHATSSLTSSRRRAEGMASRHDHGEGSTVSHPRASRLFRALIPRQTFLRS